MKVLLLLLTILSSTHAWGADPNSFNLGVITTRSVKAFTSPSQKTYISREMVLTKGSIPSDVSRYAVVAKAYFFTGEYKPCGSSEGDFNDPADFSEKGKAPDILKSSKLHAIAFAMPMEKQWKRIIIVFGVGKDLVAKVYPQDDLSKFEFPEKGIAREIK